MLDGCARQAEVDETRALAAGLGARCAVVTTWCSDTEVHRHRVAGRTRDIPGWYELDWDHVAGFLARWEEPTAPDLRLDAADRLADNIGCLRSLLLRRS